MKKTIIMAILLTIFIVPNTFGFFPITHKIETKVLIKDYKGDSNLYEMCVKHPDLCYVGNVLADISVVYYFTEGFKYEVTHSPGFCISMMKTAKARPSLGITQEEERACAVGSCLHATQDLQSHEHMVPYAIRITGLVNAIIHTFAEQKLDNIVNNKDPLVKNEVMTLGEDSWNKCIPLVREVLEGYKEYESDITTGKLSSIINTFIAEVQNSITGYDVSFENKVGFFGTLGALPLSTLILFIGSMFLWLLLAILLIFKSNKGILNYISLVLFIGLFAFQMFFFIMAIQGKAFVTFVSVIKPISNMVPIGNAENHIDIAVRNGVEFFNQGEVWIRGKEASGFSALNEADENIKWINYLYILVILGTLGLLIFLNFRTKGFKEGFKM